MLLYSIISFWFIFFLGTLSYLFYELPYKRLIRNLLYWDEREEIKEETDEDDMNNDKIKDNWYRYIYNYYKYAFIIEIDLFKIIE